MDARQIQLLDGRLRRTAYAITKSSLLELTDTISPKVVKALAEGVRGAISDAVADSLEYMEQFGMLEPITAVRKKAKRKKR